MCSKIFLFVTEINVQQVDLQRPWNLWQSFFLLEINQLHDSFLFFSFLFVCWLNWFIHNFREMAIKWRYQFRNENIPKVIFSARQKYRTSAKLIMQTFQCLVQLDKLNNACSIVVLYYDLFCLILLFTLLIIPASYLNLFHSTTLLCFTLYFHFIALFPIILCLTFHACSSRILLLFSTMAKVNRKLCLMSLRLIASWTQKFMLLRCLFLFLFLFLCCCSCLCCGILST